MLGARTFVRITLGPHSQKPKTTTIFALRAQCGRDVRAPSITEAVFICGLFRSGGSPSKYPALPTSK